MRDFINIIRNGQLEMVWQYTATFNGFKTSLFLRGTEDEVRAYIDSEFLNGGSYHAITNDQIESLGKLGIPIYCAPQL